MSTIPGLPPSAAQRITGEDLERLRRDVNAILAELTPSGMEDTTRGYFNDDEGGGPYRIEASPGRVILADAEVVITIDAPGWDFRDTPELPEQINAVKTVNRGRSIWCGGNPLHYWLQRFVPVGEANESSTRAAAELLNSFAKHVQPVRLPNGLARWRREPDELEVVSGRNVIEGTGTAAIVFMPNGLRLLVACPWAQPRQFLDGRKLHPRRISRALVMLDPAHLPELEAQP